MDEHSDHHGHRGAQRGARPALLCISPSYAPATTPTGIRASKLLQRLAARWDITLITETGRELPGSDVTVEVVPSRKPRRLMAALRRLRLSKLLDLAVWPDESIFWVLPAVKAARRALRSGSYEAVVVFMMPYSAGLVGLLLKRLSGLALVLNLDDSPTCTDMHPDFPSRLHYRLARRLEDSYVRHADAVVYVSQTNLALVAARQPRELAGKLELVRYGADPAEFERDARAEGDFQIAYVGAMTGWWALIGGDGERGAMRRSYEAWMRLGRYRRVTLDERTSSPAVLGDAIHVLTSRRPQWQGRVALTIYGNPYPEDVVARSLDAAGVADVVTVHGPVPHERVAALMDRADALFLALPRRTDGSRGGRISAKTYEYLMTDRPILAAVPRGENWDFLEGKPGVWLVDPDDRERMAAVLDELAEAKFAGRPRAIDRRELREQLSYDTRAEEFAAVIEAAVARRGERAR
jgi:glycosyltransferase involved in cell wall biosynthesis